MQKFFFHFFSPPFFQNLKQNDVLKTVNFSFFQCTPLIFFSIVSIFFLFFLYSSYKLNFDWLCCKIFFILQKIIYTFFIPIFIFLVIFFLFFWSFFIFLVIFFYFFGHFLFFWSFFFIFLVIFYFFGHFFIELKVEELSI